jgi:hypothetical protein
MGNAEYQCYNDSPQNLFLENGRLNIVARPTPSGIPINGKPFTSARLNTAGKGDWKFGRFEMRAKVPKGQGAWPAFWMMPTNSPYGVWPLSGEIDIMEVVNAEVIAPRDNRVPAGQPDNRLYGTLHYGRPWPRNVNSGANTTLPGNASLAQGFNTFAAEWEEGEIRWYLNGVHYGTHRQDGWFSREPSGVNRPLGVPFDANNPFHIILNFAVGGNWPSNVNLGQVPRAEGGFLESGGIDYSKFPQAFEVDYVRVYECSRSPQTGKGCATIDPNVQVTPGSRPPEVSEFIRTAMRIPVFQSRPSALSPATLLNGISIGGYNPPNGNVSHTRQTTAADGDILTVNSGGGGGNVYLSVVEGPTAMNRFAASGVLRFMVRVNSASAGAGLRVKVDSGWPAVSDVPVTLGAVGQWTQVQLNLSELIARGNSLQAGERATLERVVNMLVIEPSGVVNLSFKDIEWVAP